MEKEISTLDLVINRLKGHLPEYHYEVLQKEWQTLKSVVLSQPAVQQLKPKMPSFEEAVKTIGDIPAGIASPASFIAGMSVMYDYIARHFGH